VNKLQYYSKQYLLLFFQSTNYRIRLFDYLIRLSQIRLLITVYHAQDLNYSYRFTLNVFTHNFLISHCKTH